MCEAESAVGSEQDDAAVASETVEEIRDRLARGEFGRCTGGNAIGGPLAEDKLHDGLTPAGKRNSRGEIVGVAAAADQ